MQPEFRNWDADKAAFIEYFKTIVIRIKSFFGIK